MNAPFRPSFRQSYGIFNLFRFTAWLVLAELVWLLVSQPLELGLIPLAMTAAVTAVLGCLGRLWAIRWLTGGTRKRALGLALLLEILALLGVGAYLGMKLRGVIAAETELQILQAVVLAQFMSGVLAIPLLARTVGRLGAVQLIPLLRALLYWAEFVGLGALGCWIASFFTEVTFRVMFNYVGGILASGYQLALRNLLVDLLATIAAISSSAPASSPADSDDAA